jgi:hypothetical protein
MQQNAIRSFCNSCGRETDHDVLQKGAVTQQLDDGSISEVTQLLVRCGGCKEWSIREELRFFDEPPDKTANVPFRVRFKPERLWTRPPPWLEQLEQADADLKGLLDEVYTTVNDAQMRLLSMGVRSALDHVMNRIVGDLGTFEEKLAAMVSQGHLTSRQKEMLETVIDAGSASTHRSYRPPPDLLQEMIAVMETIIREHYITAPYLATARTLIPPRPPRQKKVKGLPMSLSPGGGGESSDPVS